MLKKTDQSQGKADFTSRQAIPADPVYDAQADAGLDFSYDDKDGDEGAESDSAEETARYVADMIGSLASIAREAKLDLLAYLLDMARVEAEMQARQTETPFEED